ncbi:MAG: hypothetical protein WC358_11035 [Ignavibacteria bacterium]|jgi:hypothetical protein
MGGVTEFVDKYRDHIQGVFEVGSDVKATNNLEKYMKDLEERKADHDRIQKFQDITMKLGRLDKNTLPKTKKVAIETFANTDIPEFKNTEFAKKYDEYLTSLSKTGEDGKPIPGQYFTNPKDVDTFLKEHPESEKLVEELRTKNFYKPTEKEVTMTGNEWEQNMFKTIGVTPEEAAWYKEEMQKKRDNDVNNHNQKIVRMVAERLPGLMSQGSLKNTYAEMFGNIAGTYMLEQPKYTEPKKKKLDDYSTAELKNFSAEQVLTQFNSTDAFKHIWDFNDKAREEIFKQFPNWKEQDKKVWKQEEIDKLTLEDLEKMTTEEIDDIYNFLPLAVKQEWEAKHYEQDTKSSRGPGGKGKKFSFDFPTIGEGAFYEDAYKYLITNGMAGDKPESLKKYSKEQLEQLKNELSKEKDFESAKKNFNKIIGKINTGNRITSVRKESEGDFDNYFNKVITPYLSKNKNKGVDLTEQKDIASKQFVEIKKSLSGVIARRDTQALNKALNDFMDWMVQNKFDGSVIEEMYKYIEREVSKYIK